MREGCPEDLGKPRGAVNRGARIGETDKLTEGTKPRNYILGELLLHTRNCLLQKVLTSIVGQNRVPPPQLISYYYSSPSFCPLSSCQLGSQKPLQVNYIPRRSKQPLGPSKP